MCCRAFTLIEVMVVMAIISILAGLLVPAVWRFWESEEIATTRQRLEDLKAAMIGDRTLVQNGVRTHYGFVGDNGELPFGNMSAAGGLKYLGQRPDSGYPQWAGPYMRGGFDRSSYTVDAWGRTFEYTPVLSPTRYAAAEIRSFGPNGTAYDSDDIVVLIEEKEVMPSAKLTGKIPFSRISTANYSAKIDITYPDPTAGGVRTAAECRRLAASQAIYTAAHFQKLPIGKIIYRAKIYANSSCSDASVISTLESYYFMSDSAKEMAVEFRP